MTFPRRLAGHPSLPTWIVLLVLVMCGAWFRFYSHGETQVRRPLGEDAREYYLYAFNLKTYGVYSQQGPEGLGLCGMPAPDAVRPPGFALFLSLFPTAVPEKADLSLFLFFQALLGLGILILSFFLFRQILSLFWAGCAAFLVAVSPQLISLESYVLSETLFCFFLLAMVLAGTFFLKKPSAKRAAFLGAAIGAATLIRPGLVFFPVFAALFFLFTYKFRKGTLFSLALFLGFLLLLSPWLIRNCLVLGSPTQGRLVVNYLHHGMYPDLRYKDRAETFPAPHLFDPDSPRISQSTGNALKEIKRRFQTEPWRHFYWFFIKKPLYFWAWKYIHGNNVAIYAQDASPYDTSRVFRASYALMHALHLPLVFFCFCGLILAWFKGPKTEAGKKNTVRLISLILLYYLITIIPGLPLSRYATPLRPLEFGMAIYAVSLLVGALKKKQPKERGEKA